MYITQITIKQTQRYGLEKCVLTTEFSFTTKGMSNVQSLQCSIHHFSSTQYLTDEFQVFKTTLAFRTLERSWLLVGNKVEITILI